MESLVEHLNSIVPFDTFWHHILVVLIQKHLYWNLCCLIFCQALPSSSSSFVHNTRKKDGRSSFKTQVWLFIQTLLQAYLSCLLKYIAKSGRLENESIIKVKHQILSHLWLNKISTVCTLVCKTLLPCVIVYDTAYRPVAMLEPRPHDLAESTGQISHSTCNILYDLNSQNNCNTHLYSELMTQIIWNYFIV